MWLRRRGAEASARHMLLRSARLPGGGPGREQRRAAQPRRQCARTELLAQHVLVECRVELALHSQRERVQKDAVRPWRECGGGGAVELAARLLAAAARHDGRRRAATVAGGRRRARGGGRDARPAVAAARRRVPLAPRVLCGVGQVGHLAREGEALGDEVVKSAEDVVARTADEEHRRALRGARGGRAGGGEGEGGGCGRGAHAPAALQGGAGVQRSLPAAGQGPQWQLLWAQSPRAAARSRRGGARTLLPVMGGRLNESTSTAPSSPLPAPPPPPASPLGGSGNETCIGRSVHSGLVRGAGAPASPAPPAVAGTSGEGTPLSKASAPPPCVKSGRTSWSQSACSRGSSSSTCARGPAARGGEQRGG